MDRTLCPVCEQPTDWPVGHTAKCMAAWNPPARTPTQRLLARLAAMGVPLVPETVIRRTHAGRVQREQGAWSWFVDPDPVRYTNGLGSYLPVTELVRAPRLMVVHEATSDGRGPGGRTVDVWSAATDGYPVVFQEPEGQRS